MRCSRRSSYHPELFAAAAATHKLATIKQEVSPLQGMIGRVGNVGLQQQQQQQQQQPSSSSNSSSSSTAYTVQRATVAATTATVPTSSNNRWPYRTARCSTICSAAVPSTIRTTETTRRPQQVNIRQSNYYLYIFPWFLLL